MTLNIAVFNRDHSCHPGGDAVHIGELSRALSWVGVERTYYPDGRGFAGADLIHIYHVNFTWCRMGYDVCRAHPSIPYVVNPIFYESEGFGVPFTEMRGWLDGAAAVQVYSGCGEAALRDGTRYQGLVFRIPPGVGPEFFDETDPLGRQGVIAVAARQGDKNTNKIRDACARLQIPFRLLCGIPREDMPSYYKAFRLYVTVSSSETFGLTVLEALAANCRCLVSRGAPSTFEWLPGLQPVDPSCTVEQLAATIEWAYNSPTWNYTPNVLARMRTWADYAEQIKTLYEGVLAMRAAEATHG